MQNPIAIYTANSNAEAQLISVLLEQEGIEAKAVEDQSLAGLSWFGPLPGMHLPKVFVDRSRAEEAAVIVRQFDERLKQQRGFADAKDGDTADIEATCEKCGKKSIFKASQRGTIQMCRSCGAYLDVGEPPPDDAQEWSEERLDPVDGEQ